MKTFFAIAIPILMTTSPITAQSLKTDADSLSYSLGVMLAGSLKGEGYTDLNLDLFQAAFSAVMKGQPTILDQDDCEDIVRQ